MSSELAEREKERERCASVSTRSVLHGQHRLAAVGIGWRWSDWHPIGTQGAVRSRLLAGSVFSAGVRPRPGAADWHCWPGTIRHYLVCIIWFVMLTSYRLALMCSLAVIGAIESHRALTGILRQIFRRSYWMRANKPSIFRLILNGL